MKEYNIQDAVRCVIRDEVNALCARCHICDRTLLRTRAQVTDEFKA